MDDALAGDGQRGARVKTEIIVTIENVGDIVTARQQGRLLAGKSGFSSTDATLVATAISELARNIVLYAHSGQVNLVHVNKEARAGIRIVASDEGPGIADLQRALMSGYSTSGGLGLGLCGVRRIMDEFHVDTEPGQGTTVTVTKWLR